MLNGERVGRRRTRPMWRWGDKGGDGVQAKRKATAQLWLLTHTTKQWRMGNSNAMGRINGQKGITARAPGEELYLPRKTKAHLSSNKAINFPLEWNRSIFSALLCFCFTTLFLSPFAFGAFFSHSTSAPSSGAHFFSVFLFFLDFEWRSQQNPFELFLPFHSLFKGFWRVLPLCNR